MIGLHHAFVLLHQRRLGIDLLLGNGVGLGQGLVALQIEPGVLQQGAVALERALGLHQHRLIGSRIDLGQKLALFDEAALGHIDLEQAAIDLGADQIALPGLNRADGADGHRYVLRRGDGRRYRHGQALLTHGFLRTEDRP